MIDRAATDLAWLDPFRDAEAEAEALDACRREGMPPPLAYRAGDLWGLRFTVAAGADGHLSCLLAAKGRKPSDARCKRFFQRLCASATGVAEEGGTSVRNGRFFVLRKSQVN